MTDVRTSLQGRPLPLIDVVNGPFFEGAVIGVLRAQQCVDSGRLQYYPRPQSVYTGGAVRWIDLSGKAVVYSYTVVRQNQAVTAFHDQVPYIVALLDLDEGIRMMGNIVNCACDQVRVGGKVQVSFHCVDEDSQLFLPFWELVSEGRMS
jgi:uncharacterized OB-fold protein